MTSVCLPALAQALLNTAERAANERLCRSTVLTSLPSTYTRAWPRVGPTGPYQVTRDPLNVNVAVAPAFVA